MVPRFPTVKGYYAVDPNDPGGSAKATAALTPLPAANRPASLYARAAMDRGAPAPEDVLFKVRVLPASAITENVVAPGNDIDPNSKMKGPFRRFEIDFAVPPSELHLAILPDGRHTGQVDFTAFVENGEGNILNRAGKVINLNLTPETYKRFMEGAVDMHLEVSAPAKGNTYFRIGIHDIGSNRIGVVEIPVSDVLRAGSAHSPGRRWVCQIAMMFRR